MSTPAAAAVTKYERRPALPTSCSTLAELVGRFQESNDELIARIEADLQRYANAGLIGNLTIAFRKAQNGARTVKVLELSRRT